MRIVRSIPGLRAWRQEALRQQRSVAFVPTMGALHEGHLSLVRRARRLAGLGGRVVVSIFVNPTQFNQKSDLRKYPRTLLSDAAMCRKAGADLVFAPSAAAMYPRKFSTWVEETELSLPLCGDARPGHFRGVCTVVLKLFHLVQPAVAFFGQKDAQQAAVIRRMTRDLDVPVRVVVAPLVREKNGLAMSSRNTRLTPQERKQAVALSRGLREARLAFRRGERRVTTLRRVAMRPWKGVPGWRLDYLEVVEGDTLQRVKRASRGNLMAVAVFLGKVRLIDNVLL